MANSYENLIDAVHHVPTDVAHPVLAGVTVAAVAGLGVAAKHYHNNTHERGAYDMRGNGKQIRASLIGTETKNNRYRFAPVRNMAAGLGLLAVSYVGQPGYDATFNDNNAEAVAVLDASSSMVYSHDLGDSKTSRYNAAVNALKAADFYGSLGFVETGATSNLIAKPSKNWRQLAPALDKPQVGPNGSSQLVIALEKAASVITEDPKTHKRAGAIILISDGSINETSTELHDEANVLRKQGITLRAIVPGTTDGSYLLPQTDKPTKAGTDPGVFSGFGDKPTTATNLADVTNALHTEIRAVGTRHEHHSWPGLKILGLAALALAGGQVAERTLRKK